MDGITDCAYRTVVSEIFAKHGDPAHQLWTFSEFMSAEWYVRNPRKLVRHVINTPDQKVPFVAQIYGWDGDNLVQTAIDIEHRYGHLFAGIELNIGCPSPKVMKWWSGAGMMCDRPGTLDIVRRISEAISLPFSVKVRAWLTADDKDAQYKFILDCAPYCSMITVHGRTYKQSHSGDVDRDYIHQVKSDLAHLPITIIGNGWLTWYSSGLERVGNLDGVMRGQAAMTRPRVLVPHQPDLTEIRETIMRHLHLCIAHQIWFDDESHWTQEEKYTGTFTQPTQAQIEEIILQIPTHYADQDFHSIVEFRKHLFWYVSWLIGNKEFKQSVIHVKSYAPLVTAIEELWSKQEI
jgi:tRNA-dihydrouridine synthase